MSTVETIEMTRRGSEVLFDAGFWIECEQEADRLLRAMTGGDEE